MGNKLGLDKKFQRFLSRKDSILRAIGNNSVNFFKVEVFDAQAWLNWPVQRWKPRKDQSDRPSRRILVDTGAGRQSIHIAQISQNSVTIRAEAEYMRYHNTGTPNMPKRQFMGDSKILNKQNQAILAKQMRGIL